MPKKLALFLERSFEYVGGFYLPPCGKALSSRIVIPLIYTALLLISLANFSSLLKSLVNTAAISPYSVLLAKIIASSLLFAVTKLTIGPKLSV
jgi:hypothetical protein